ncbi:MAG: HD domain-containing protein [Clostridia bacterium]|nr:HD domain-containing protein [Clostridia bacterium]
MRIGNMLKEQENTEALQNNNSSYKILAVDDEIGIVDSLSIFLKRSGYSFAGETDPVKAIERLKTEHFDLLLLDFIMTPLHGDQVVEEIRKFNKDLYIILLTGHKDLAPPLETIRRLDIQGYCEKSDKFDQLLLLIESGIKSVAQMNEIKRINDELSDTYEKLEQAYMESIQTVRYTVEAKDTYTRGHSDRVSEYSVLIGQKLGLPEEDIRRLRIGGLFHDIGKIGVPDNILQKNGKLSDDEYSEIKNHPTIGVHILSNATMFQDILPIVKHHHERYDGRGYPSQLKGEEIPYLARIAAVADAFDAMTSRRVYRDSLPIDTVITEIEKNKGTQFDPQIAETFLDILKNNYSTIKEIQEKFIS